MENGANFWWLILKRKESLNHYTFVAEGSDSSHQLEPDHLLILNLLLAEIPALFQMRQAAPF